jgi:hypothetical protein
VESLRILAVALASALLLPLPLEAQEDPSYAATKGMDERFRLDVGGFFQKFDTTIRYDSATGLPGTEVSLEDVLGSPSSQTNFRVDGYWRFGRHGRFDFAYRSSNRTSAAVLAQTVRFGDQTYNAGGRVDTEIRVRVGELYYSYSFVNSGEAELGLQLGISAYFNKLSISASGTIVGPGGPVSGSVAEESKNAIAPLPAIGGYFRYTLLPQFFVWGKAKGMKATISGDSGSIVDLSAGLDLYVTKNIGLGGGYEYVKITYSNSETKQLSLNYRYSGPMAYLTIAF